MTNNLKTPPVTGQTKILCFDAESNGLHGEAFAIGAVVIDMKGKIQDSFTGRCNIVGKVDDWVQQNVAPAITGMGVTHSSYKHLREHFWVWFTKAQKSVDYVVVQNGYPVEYRLMMQCQEDDIDARYWDHPFPVLDLTSMMICKNSSANELKKGIVVAGSAHNPMYDATLTAKMAVKLLGG